MNPLRVLFIALMIISCKQCQYRYSIDASLRQNSDLFVTGTCPKCNTKCNQCLLCSKIFSISSSKNDYRQIKAHVRVCQESRDHCDNQHFNREEGNDTQHYESVPYHDSNNSMFVTLSIFAKFAPMEDVQAVFFSFLESSLGLSDMVQSLLNVYSFVRKCQILHVIKGQASAF